mmetsp:Transcript_110691/g.307764  ORF Transcript_110691/g.307764 Transcript_110691/m.307764 type:complete len:311 (+) Transcript_110691:55-987(+)
MPPSSGGGAPSGCATRMTSPRSPLDFPTAEAPSLGAPAAARSAAKLPDSVRGGTPGALDFGGTGWGTAEGFKGPSTPAACDRTTSVTPSLSSLYSDNFLARASSAIAFSRDSDHFSVSHRFSPSGGPTVGTVTASMLSSKGSTISSASTPSSGSVALSSRPLKRVFNNDWNSANVCVAFTANSVGACNLLSRTRHGRTARMMSPGPSSSSASRTWTATCRPSPKPSRADLKVLSSLRMANCFPAWPSRRRSRLQDTPSKDTSGSASPSSATPRAAASSATHFANGASTASRRLLTDEDPFAGKLKASFAL